MQLLDIYSLYIEGILAGMALSAIFWVIGFAIHKIASFMNA